MFIENTGIDISKIGKINNKISERNCNDISSKSISLLRSMMIGHMPLLLHMSLKDLIFGLNEKIDKIPTKFARGNPDYVLRFKPAGKAEEVFLEMPEITEIQYGNRQAFLPWLFNNVKQRSNCPLNNLFF